jgi:hypothetical protein
VTRELARQRVWTYRRCEVGAWAEGKPASELAGVDGEEGEGFACGGLEGELRYE